MVILGVAIDLFGLSEPKSKLWIKRRKFFHRVQPEVVQEIGRCGVEDGSSRRFTAAHLFDQAVAKQGMQDRVRIHTPNIIYLRTRGRLLVCDHRQDLQGRFG